MYGAEVTAHFDESRRLHGLKIDTWQKALVVLCSDQDQRITWLHSFERVRVVLGSLSFISSL